MDIIKLNDFPMNPEPNGVYEIIPDKAKIVSSTNRLFNKYPTRYISAVPRFAINKYSIPGDSVLDPFCGSGTTAIEAMLLSRNALSIDIDPFARLLIKAKTTVYSEADFQLIQEVVQFLQDNAPDPSADYPVPEIPNIKKWFCERSIVGLSYIKFTIDRLCINNSNVKDFLYVALAGIIRKVSNADEVSPKPYVSTRYPKTPAEPLELFFKVEAMYREAIKEFSDATRNNGCQSIILSGNDARTVSTMHDVDLGVSSPPYINAYDYVRSLKFEDLWLGLADDAQLRNNRRKYIGTEIAGSFYETYVYASQSSTLVPLVENIAKVDNKRAGVVNTYFEDMALNMIAVRDALKQNGRYVIVVGDSNIRGQEIPTAKVLTEIAEKNGFSYELSFKYVIRDRYLHLPRGGRGGIIKYDEILVLRKD